MRILIVDDDLDILTLLKDIIGLKFPSVELDSTKNGFDALEKIKNSGPEKYPHLVLTDMKMPVMNGAELCRIIKEKFPGIKVALMTAFKETGECFDKIFFKPLDFEELFSYIRQEWVG